MARKPSPSCTLIAGGDIALNRKNPRGAFGRLSPIIRKADLAFANLELPLSRSGRPAAGKIIIRGAPEMAEALAEARFDALSVANNHMLDYGEEAFFETLDLLDRRAIPHVGAGKNLAAAGRPRILERGGLRIGLLAYCSVIPRGFAAGPGKAGVNPLWARTAYQPSVSPEDYPGAPPEVLTWAEPEDLRRMARAVRRLRKRVDLVIVNHHWGTSMVHEVRAFQSQIARAAVDAGADLVLGGHSHVLQAVEFYKGVPVVYSMGNLIFDFEIPFFTEATRQTFLFGCTLTKKGALDPYLLPCRIGRGGTPEPLSPRQGPGREVVRIMERLSAPYGARLAAKGERVSLKPGLGVSGSVPKITADDMKQKILRGEEWSLRPLESAANG